MRVGAAGAVGAVVVGLVVVVGLAVACGGVAPGSRAAVEESPSASPASSGPSPQPSPSVLANAPEQLVLTGAINLRIDHAAIGTPCGKLPAGYFVTVRFDVGSQPYAADVMIADYSGPQSYPAPPARVSVHTLGLIQKPVLFASTSGQATVAAGEQSGTFDADLASQTDKAHVSGAWRCP